MSKEAEQQKLIVRNVGPDDLDAVSALVRRVYPGMSTYTHGMLRGQMHAFPEGCWVATFGDRVVGYCATIRVDEKSALGPHTWHGITGGGYGSTHDDEGEYLYGYEVCVDPEIRRYRIGQRFYRERRRLAEKLGLKGIVIAGRIPGYERRRKEFATPQDYVEAVRDRKLRDPVINFQLRNGFELIGVLEDYLPADKQSLGSAAHMVWRNPQYVEPKELPGSTAPVIATGVNRVRLACVQYGQRRIRSFDEFRQFVTYFVDVTADYRCDFVVFPELFTMQLLSVENEAIPPAEA
ncbi:MAG: GNAT family N-acetyltransferase, partial [Gammaproteobacteria bacterium]|nr:GNAT family N-acetyltransferase [Gammaproteobacteria bacterium]